MLHLTAPAHHRQWISAAAAIISQHLPTHITGRLFGIQWQDLVVPWGLGVQACALRTEDCRTGALTLCYGHVLTIEGALGTLHTIAKQDHIQKTIDAYPS